jgi:hypothetical protein
MPKNPPAVSWRIECESREEAERLARFAREEFPLDKVMSKVVQAFPNNIEVTIIERYRLNEFFRAMDVIEGTGDRPVFWIVFRVCPEADHYWKDVAARILHSVHDAGLQVSITIDQGNQQPACA